MTPREAAISVINRLELRLKQTMKSKEDTAKDCALQAIIKGSDAEATQAKEYYAQAKTYEAVLKEVDCALREELAELAKPEVPGS